MMTCIAIDDEPLALEVVRKLAAKIPELKLLGTYTDALEAKEIIPIQKPQLLLLDIQMPDISGLQFYRQLPFQPIVVFTTAYREYAADGFEVDAVDYLLKPFTLLRFQQAIRKANARLQQLPVAEPPALYIHHEYKLLRIPLSDIIYVEALDDYVKIHTKGKHYLTLMPLKQMQEKLPPQLFIRIHRSYLVAKNQIQFVQFRKLGLLTGLELPVGETYRTELAAIFNV